jgi:hypothetical protein
VFLGLPDVNGALLVGNFVFPYSYKINQSPLMMRSKLRLVCSLILKRNAPGTLRSAFKNDSMALFIGAESFHALFREIDKLCGAGSLDDGFLVTWASGSDNDQTE